MNIVGIAAVNAIANGLHASRDEFLQGLNAKGNHLPIRRTGQYSHYMPVLARKVLVNEKNIHAMGQ